MAFVKVIGSARVLPGRVAVGRVGVRQVAVTRIDGRLFAFANACPHAGSPLSGGRLSGTCIECPRHGWRFDLASGACLDQELYSLRTYPVREAEGWVEVDADDGSIW